MSREQRLVLRLEKVVPTGTAGQVRPGTGVSIELRGGDLVVLGLDHTARGTALADVCCGLLPLAKGSVHFLGRQWYGLEPDIANALRGKIGRIFPPGRWLDYQTVEENVMLPQLHHTLRPVGEIRNEAARLSRQVGLPGMPSGYPDQFAPSDLQRAGWVRAFMGTPALILMEEPTHGLRHDVLSGFLNTIGEACERGTAVVWMTLLESIWQDTAIPAKRRYRMIGDQLIEVKRT